MSKFNNSAKDDVNIEEYNCDIDIVVKFDENSSIKILKSVFKATFNSFEFKDDFLKIGDLKQISQYRTNQAKIINFNDEAKGLFYEFSKEDNILIELIHELKSIFAKQISIEDTVRTNQLKKTFLDTEAVALIEFKKVDKVFFSLIIPLYYFLIIDIKNKVIQGEKNNFKKWRRSMNSNSNKKIDLDVLYGSKSFSSDELTAIKVGDAIKLTRLPEECLTVYSNGEPIALATSIMIDGFAGIRIIKLLS